MQFTYFNSIALLLPLLTSIYQCFYQFYINQTKPNLLVPTVKPFLFINFLWQNNLHKYDASRFYCNLFLFLLSFNSIILIIYSISIRLANFIQHHVDDGVVWWEDENQIVISLSHWYNKAFCTFFCFCSCMVTSW